MKKVLLIIRDGWGYRESSENNAIAQANTHFTDSLMEKYQNILLDASGLAVGLPEGYMGNSEVGHMTIGSGRIIEQSLTRINKSIGDGSFFRNKELLDIISHCRNSGTTLHLMGLLQTEGVHAHIDHLFAIFDVCKIQGLDDVLIHIFTDGRDAPITDSEKYIKMLQDKLDVLGFGKIVTISGRYFAMDRNHKRDRIQKVYNLIINGVDYLDKNNKKINNNINGVDFHIDYSLGSVDIIKKLHFEGETDEFIKPVKISNYNGMQDDDGLIFRNFRTDRTRQLTQSIIEDNFKEFIREKKNIKFLAMTQYYDNMISPVIFPEIELKNIIGEVVSKAGYRQLRISETEKYAHVTFFMNGQKDEAFLNEDRLLIDSPNVDKYDKQPEMSIVKLSDRLCLEIKKEKYQLVITNFVNGDMIGHTGNIDAIKKGLEAVDHALEKTINLALAHNYTIIVTADHGNAEDQSLRWMTSHTLNPVPCIFVGKDFEKLIKENSKEKNTSLMKIKLKDNCGLKDIAPTILNLLDIDKPKDMTGESIYFLE